MNHPPPGIRALLAELHDHNIDVAVSARAHALRVRWPDTITPEHRDALTRQLITAKPALLDAANGRCAWCSTRPKVMNDFATGWPICHDCAKEAGADWLQVEQPALLEERTA